DTFLRDTQTATPTSIATQTAGKATISANGRYIGYISGSLQPFIYDTVSLTTTEIPSTVSSGGNDISISSTGRVVLTTSAAVLPADTDGMLDVYTYDLADSTVKQVSLHNNGTNPDKNAQAFRTAITPDGRYVVFSSDADMISNVVVPYKQI